MRLRVERLAEQQAAQADVHEDRAVAIVPVQREQTAFAGLKFQRALGQFRVRANLRAAGLNVTTYPEPVKLPKQFKFGDRMGMRVMLVVGPDEAALGKVTVKDLASGAQETVTRADAVEVVRKILEGPAR